MQISNALNFSCWQGTYQRLVHRFLSPDRAALFARGLLALSGHQQILSPQGQVLLKEAQVFSSAPHGINSILIDSLPSIESPNLSLFVSPLATLSQGDKQILIDGINSNVLQITAGCANQCLMCGLDAPSKMVHMPFPMILAIAKEFFSGSMFVPILLYFNSDPLHYRDIYFGANYYDAITALKRMGIAFNRGISHGWQPMDYYALSAAEQMAANQITVQNFSFHFIHKGVAEYVVPAQFEMFGDPGRVWSVLIQNQYINAKGRLMPKFDGKRESFSLPNSGLSSDIIDGVFHSLRMSHPARPWFFSEKELREKIIKAKVENPSPPVQLLIDQFTQAILLLRPELIKIFHIFDGAIEWTSWYAEEIFSKYILPKLDYAPKLDNRVVTYEGSAIELAENWPGIGLLDIRSTIITDEKILFFKPWGEVRILEKQENPWDGTIQQGFPKRLFNGPMPNNLERY